MALTGRQVRQLRSMAHHLSPLILVGKGNVNESLVAQAGECLEAHELVKCSVLEMCDLTAREAADELAERCGAEVVQVIGRKFTLYRRSQRKDVEHIELA